MGTGRAGPNKGLKSDFDLTHGFILKVIFIKD